MFRESLLDVGGVRLNVAVGPANGPPLVLLHGVTRRWQSFLPLVPWLATRWQIFAVDHRGHGASDRADRYLVDDYVHDAVRLVERHLPGPAVLCGHSLGGMTAAAVAAARPDLAIAVVSEDPPLHTMGNAVARASWMGFFRGVQRTARAGGTVAELAARLADLDVSDTGTGKVRKLKELRDPLALRFSAACLAQFDPEVLAPIVEERWLQDFEPEAVFGAVRAPLLLVQADPAAGGMLTDEDADRVAALCPTLVRVRFPGAPHVVHWAKTAELANALIAFLESVRPSS